MTRLERADKIEGIVGASRHLTLHLARAVSAEQRVYILHSHECLYEQADLRDCPYSLALDNGIDIGEWEDWQDRPVVLEIDPEYDDLTPLPMPTDHTIGGE